MVEQMIIETIALAVVVCACLALLVAVFRLKGRKPLPPNGPATEQVIKPPLVRQIRNQPAEPEIVLPGAEYLTDPEALPDVPDAVPDTMADGARFGRLTVRAATVRGDAARGNARVRRQAVSLAVLDSFSPPVLVSAVAAGRPAGRRSQLGAVQACRSIQYKLADAARNIEAAWPGVIDGDPEAATQMAAALAGAMRGVVDPINEVARSRGLAPDDIATELTCLLTRLGDSPSRAHIAFGVGTGPVLVLRSGGVLDTQLDPGQPTGRSAALLPMAPEEMRWKSFATAPGEVALACTATTERLLCQESFAKYLADDWQVSPPSLISFLAQLSILDRICRDDRAAAGLWESPAGRGD
jgi:Protein phosphatase 2C